MLSETISPVQTLIPYFCKIHVYKLSAEMLGKNNSIKLGVDWNIVAGLTELH